MLREQNCLFTLYDAGMLLLTVGICLALSNHLYLGTLVIQGPVYLHLQTVGKLSLYARNALI